MSDDLDFLIADAQQRTDAAEKRREEQRKRSEAERDAAALQTFRYHLGKSLGEDVLRALEPLQITGRRSHWEASFIRKGLPFTLRYEVDLGTLTLQGSTPWDIAEFTQFPFGARKRDEFLLALGKATTNAPEGN